MEPNEFLSPNLLFDQLISFLSTNLPTFYDLSFLPFFSKFSSVHVSITKPKFVLLWGRNFRIQRMQSECLGMQGSKLVSKLSVSGEIDEVDASRPRDRGL